MDIAQTRTKELSRRKVAHRNPPRCWTPRWPTRLSRRTQSRSRTTCRRNRHLSQIRVSQKASTQASRRQQKQKQSSKLRQCSQEVHRASVMIGRYHPRTPTFPRCCSEWVRRYRDGTQLRHTYPRHCLHRLHRARICLRVRQPILGFRQSIHGSLRTFRWARYHLPDFSETRTSLLDRHHRRETAELAAKQGETSIVP